jgi:hypothetical protein
MTRDDERYAAMLVALEGLLFALGFTADATGECLVDLLPADRLTDHRYGTLMQRLSAIMATTADEDAVAAADDAMDERELRHAFIRGIFAYYIDHGAPT